MRLTSLTILAAIILFGCNAPSYGIRVIDGLPKETYLIFSKGSPVTVGEVFSLYHIQQRPMGGNGHGGHAGHGGAGSGPVNLKHEVGRVQVIKIADDTHALVRILIGIATDDVQVEKVE